jgi:hypothetical protein
MTKIVIISLSLLVSLFAKGQTLNDPIYLNVNWLPNTNVEAQTGKVRSHFVEINATLPPVSIGRKVKLLNGFYYRSSTFGFDHSFAQETLFPSTLHDIRYSAIIRAQVTNYWELVAIPRLMIRSDLQQVFSASDLFSQVVAIANYVIKGNEQFKIGLGFALNNDFERNAIIPIGSLYYESKRVKAEIIYPNASFLYKKNENVEFGLFTTVDGAISRISPFFIQIERVDYLRSFQVLVSPTVSHKLFNNLFGHLKIGYVPIRNFETLNARFKPAADGNYHVQSSLFLRVGVSYRIKS